jgi:hypothetical protein
VTPHGVSASVRVYLRSGWVGIPFWKRRHKSLTIEKRHQTLLVASKISHDSLGYLHATRCGFSLHNRKLIDITSASMQKFSVRMTPLSGPFRGLTDGLPVIIERLRCSGLPIVVRNVGTTTARQTEDLTYDKAFPCLTWRTEQDTQITQTSQVRRLLGIICNARADCS